MICCFFMICFILFAKVQRIFEMCKFIPIYLPLCVRNCGSSRRKKNTGHLCWMTSNLTDKRRTTPTLRPSGRGGAFGYARIQFRRNRQSDGSEGRTNGTAEDDGKSAGEAVTRLHRELTKKAEHTQTANGDKNVAKMHDVCGI